MLFKFTLDQHVLKSLFLKFFVDEYSYHIQYFNLDSRSTSIFSSKLNTKAHTEKTVVVFGAMWCKAFGCKL